MCFVQFEGQSAELIDSRQKTVQAIDDQRATALKLDILEKFGCLFISVSPSFCWFKSVKPHRKQLCYYLTERVLWSYTGGERDARLKPNDRLSLYFPPGLRLPSHPHSITALWHNQIILHCDRGTFCVWAVGESQTRDRLIPIGVLCFNHFTTKPHSQCSNGLHFVWETCGSLSRIEWRPSVFVVSVQKTRVTRRAE